MQPNHSPKQPQHPHKTQSVPVAVHKAAFPQIKPRMSQRDLEQPKRTKIVTPRSAALSESEQQKAMEANIHSVSKTAARISVDEAVSLPDLSKVFQEIAGDDNKIEKSEWKSVCQNVLRLNLSEDELDRVFDSLDTDNSKTLEFEEFKHGVQRWTFLKSVVGALSNQTSFTMPDKYDCTKSTCENYIGSPNVFVGKYAKIRENLDYSYHVNVTPERQLWQDSILDTIVIRNEPQATPWVVFTCGAMGAGKGHVLSWMSCSGNFPLEHIVHIDPDHFKMVMPEWERYVKENSEEAGTLCHKESSMMAEIAQEVAMEKRQHIWVDGSLRDGDWYAKVFDDLRREFPHYQLAIFFIFASEEKVRARVKQRAIETGREISECLIRDSLKQPEQTLAKLTPKADFVARINNDGEVPKLETFQVIDHRGNFSVIRDQFARSHPPPHHFPESLAPLVLAKTKLTAENFAFKTKKTEQTSPTPIARRVSAKDVLDGECLTWEPVNMASVSPQCAELDEITKFSSFSGKMSPASPVLMGLKARKVMQVPENAAFMRWCYGIVAPNLYCEKRVSHLLHDPSAAFIFHGGQVFFDDQQRIVGVLGLGGFAIDSRFPANSDVHTLQFTHPIPLGLEDLQALREQDRFRHESLDRLNRSVYSDLFMCWMGPGELYDCPAGAFVYIFYNPDKMEEMDESRVVGCAFPVL